MVRLPSTAQTSDTDRVQHGTISYGQALTGAGGQTLEVLRRREERSSVAVGLYASPPYDLKVPALGVSRLSINLTGAHVSGGIDGERQKTFRATRHSLFLTPEGACAHWRKESPSRHLNIYFHAESLFGPGDARGAPRDFGIPLFNASFPGLNGLVDALVAELDGAFPWSVESADSLSRLILIKLARLRTRQRTARNPLTPQLLGRVQDYVRAHLAERILVADMAAVVGLPPNRFAQAYSHSTGHAPHQYVMSQRLKQAESLLLGSKVSLAQIAVDSGFASQQHMTQAMRKQLGITPARLRASADVAPAQSTMIEST